MMSTGPSQSINWLGKGRTPVNRKRSAGAFVSILHVAAAWVIFLYLIFSPIPLLTIGWHYLGEGLELEKIHPATYLLVLLLPTLMVFDPRFKQHTFRQVTYFPLGFFILTCFAVTLYATAEKGVSIAPFVDTFFSTILVAIIAGGMRRGALIHLRLLLDAGIAANVLLMIIGFVTQHITILDFPVGFPDAFGPTRWVGALGAPLSAAHILCAYPLIVLATMPPRITKMSAARLCLAIVVLFASSLTGGRSAVGIMITLLIVYAVYSTMVQIGRGSVKKTSLWIFTICVALLVFAIPVMLQLGLFDSVLARLEFDNGSAIAREIAFAILNSMSAGDLLLGIPAASAAAQQQEYGLIAIEISWINFILICGLLFTIPFFISFNLFLFRYLPKYCESAILLFSTYTIVLTFSYNSIWSKTTVLAITVAIGFSNLRRDLRSDNMAISNSSEDRHRLRKLVRNDFRRSPSLVPSEDR